MDIYDVIRPAVWVWSGWFLTWLFYLKQRYDWHYKEQMLSDSLERVKHDRDRYYEQRRELTAKINMLKRVLDE